METATLVTGVAHPVDVAGRGEAAHRPGRVDVPSHKFERAVAVGQREDLFVLTTLQDAGDAPGHVVVNHRLLPGQPDHCRHRERAVRLGVEQVALVAGRVSAPQRRGQEGRWCWQAGTQYAGHAIGGLLPVQGAGDFGADRPDEAGPSCPS